MNIKSSLLAKDEFLILTAPYMEVYIPTDFFDSGLAENLGSSINTLGLLNARVFDDGNSPGFLEILNLPTKIVLYPSDMETKKLKLSPLLPEENYMVCKFYKDMPFMRKELVKASDNAELFFNLLIRGKIPRNIPYDKILTVWRKNLDLNGVNFKVPSSILELIIREVYRDPKTGEPYGKLRGNKPMSEWGPYTTANMRNICAKNSTFAAITFEDFDAMVTTSLNRKKQGKNQNISPIEKIIKM